MRAWTTERTTEGTLFWSPGATTPSVVMWVASLTATLLSGCGAPTNHPPPRAPTAMSSPKTVAADAREATGPEAPGLPPVSVEPLSSDVWLHTSYFHIPGVGPFPSHGLIVRSGDQALLVDTAWTVEQTHAILVWARQDLPSSIGTAVVTHAHNDKMGGMAALHGAGIQTYALDLTNRDAPGRDLLPAQHSLASGDELATLADGAVQVYYPGPGHTVDNVVVYVAAAEVLFGGCLIRPGKSDSLGNLADADVAHWAQAVENVKRRFPNARIIVPSHGDPGGPELLDHTIALARDQNRRP